MINLDGYDLTLAEAAQFVKGDTGACLNPCLVKDETFEKSCLALQKIIDQGHKIYGVNTLFGGLANQAAVAPEELQQQLVLSHMAGAGEPLPDNDVKLAMLLRANSLCHGVSGIRRHIVERYLQLANDNILPLVHEFGSIGASGDLIPLSAIAGAITGLSDDFKLKHNGHYESAPKVLAEQGLETIALQPKEGLALINGTSVLTAIAANNCIQMASLFNLHLQLNAVMCEIMGADIRAFSPFIQQHRPHPGQRWIASTLQAMLSHSPQIRSHQQVEADFHNQDLIQDRYSIRCMPQFLGAIVEDLCQINRTVSTEMNGATDNPLIDPNTQEFFHGGNFLGQHVSMAMDKMRICIALLAKHNEAQLATLVEPAFNRGLPASLVAPQDMGRTVGVKPLQILSNSLTPLLEQNANPLCTHFPVHGEQFNQNINSQGFGAAQLTRKSLTIYRQQLSCFALVLGHCLTLKRQRQNLAASGFSNESQSLWQTLGKLKPQPSNQAEFIIDAASAGKTSGWLHQVESWIAEGKFTQTSPYFGCATQLDDKG